MEHFEKSVQKTQEWVKDLMGRLETDNPHKAFEILKGTLMTLRDRLPLELAVKFGAQLPVLLRGFYYEGWRPLQTPVKMKNKEDFVEELKRHNRGFAIDDDMTLDMGWESIVQVVFDVINYHVSAGEMQKLRDVLPKSFKDWVYV